MGRTARVTVLLLALTLAMPVAAGSSLGVSIDDPGVITSPSTTLSGTVTGPDAVARLEQLKITIHRTGRAGDSELVFTADLIAAEAVEFLGDDDGTGENAWAYSIDWSGYNSGTYYVVVYAAATVPNGDAARTLEEGASDDDDLYLQNWARRYVTVELPEGEEADEKDQYRNHGAYVSSVARQRPGGAAVSEAARSNARSGRPDRGPWGCR